MAMEHERKYLVKSDEWRKSIQASSKLRQGYLAINERCSVRVRLSEDSATLTVKTVETKGTGRIELEYPVELPEARELLSRVARGVVSKVRYQLALSPHDWTIDVFEDANEGLVLLEIESAEDFLSPNLPSWVGEEVTNNPRFQNSFLSQEPYASWDREDRGSSRHEEGTPNDC